MRIVGAGELRQLVTIQAKGPLNTDGVPDPQWLTVAENIPAKVEELGGAHLFPEDVPSSAVGRSQLVPTETHRVTIRYYAGLDATHRLLLDGGVLDIVSVSDIERLNAYMVLRCRQRIGVTA